MKNALKTMLEMQDRMNTRVHEDWINQGFEWYRAVWIECGELMDHQGYKWWKKQSPDTAQVQLEVIDIWHFGMSALLAEGGSHEAVAERIMLAVADYPERADSVLEATEALAGHALETRSFSPGRFWNLMRASGLDFDALYRSYVGKNVLNFFRQDNGYQEGSYEKTWSGREDNEHLVELVESLDASDGGFADDLYRALEARYRECVAS